MKLICAIALLSCTLTLSAEWGIRLNVYGEGKVTGLGDTLYLADYPYFALYILSPDGKEELRLPFRIDTGVVSVTLEPDGVIL